MQEMYPEQSTAAPESPHVSPAQAAYAVLRFLMAVRYRFHVVLAALLVAMLLGGLYWATAKRFYSAKAQLLVMYVSTEAVSPGMGITNSMHHNNTPTFESLMTTSKVVEGAVQRLDAESCPDLADLPKDRWTGAIQGGLASRAVRNTNILNVTYRCRNADSAVNVLNALVESYIEFLDKTSKGTAGEIVRVLTKEKNELTEKLAQKEREMVETRRTMGDMGIHSDSRVLRPVVQQAVALNESLIQAQKRRIELDASLAAVQVALRGGGDMYQHVMGLADAVGKEILFRSLGFDTQDTSNTMAMERGVLDDRTALRAMQEHLGPSHPEVLAKVEKIRMSEQYLAEYQQRIRQRLAEIQNTRIGPMLVEMLEQKLNEARQLEASFRQQFERAQAEAVSLNGQIANLEIIEHDLTWLRNLQKVLLDRIASIELKHEGPDIRTALVEPPKAPNSPVSPLFHVVALLTLAGGLAMGLGLVWLLEVLDDRFRSLDELQMQTRIPVLTIVRQLQSAEGTGPQALHMHAAPDSPESEAFRTLRTALALADGETRRLVISSAEPSDGKTTVLANLAVCYAQADKRTLLIDADLRRPGLTAMLGMRGIDGLSRVLRGERDVAEMAAAHIRPSGIERLDVLPCGARPGNPTELLSGPRFSELLAWAETVYDQVLVDGPPTLITSDVAVIGRLVDGVVLVVQPDKNRRRQVLRAIETLTILKVPLLGSVVNRLRSDQDHGYYGYGSGYGYGYGYHYGEGYKESAAAQANAGTSADGHAPQAAAGGEAGGGLVPRRAA